MTTGCSSRRRSRRPATASSRSTTATAHRRHPHLGRPARALRRRGTGRHRREQGLARRPLAGRHDAPLVPQAPRRPTKVDDLVGLAPSNHGTTNPGALITGATFCPACLQQRAGSDFLRTLNAGDETPGDVSYTVVETRHDEVVTPFTSAFLAPGPNTANILIQDDCPADLVDHTQIHNNPVVLRWTLQALGRPGPADPTHPPGC